MLVSYNWLKKYFTDLPSPTDLEQGIIFHAFEVENLIARDNDYLLDIKVLPDRSHDCLCHRGIAREIGAIFNLPVIYPQLEGVEEKETEKDLSVTINDPKLCRRYIGRLIEGVEVREPPDWLREALAAIDQRSINVVVDAANYVMFDTGQPLHAFDADKVSGGIIIRRAKAGEKLTTLDNQDVNLDEETLIIADDEGPLAIAGIKGGKRAEVSEQTKNIILESANFNPVSVRKTSARLGIRTDASKRFENELSTEVAGYAMDEFTDLIIKLAGTKETKIGPVVDEYRGRNLPPQIVCTVSEINKILGLTVSQKEMTEILERLGMIVEAEVEELTITPPAERLDVDIKEAIVEEVGRIYGYDKIAPLELEPFARPPAGRQELEVTLAEKNYAVQNKIREILLGRGFSEVALYPIVSKGELELANPLAEDKSHLRADLITANLDRLAFNLPNVLFDTEAVKIFEFGHIFKKEGEEAHLAIGVASKAKKFEATAEIETVISAINSGLGIKVKSCLVGEDSKPEIKGKAIEINLDKLVEQVTNLPVPNLNLYIASDQIVYNPASAYPRIIRDIALWVPVGNLAVSPPSELGGETAKWDSKEEVARVIRDSAGPLLVEGPILFDEFTKGDKKSLAFRLVLQSYEKTLSDDEANAVMAGVTLALEQNEGWEVRK